MRPSPLVPHVEDLASASNNAASGDLQDTMMSSDGEASCLPPPHIAARFHRSTRRKSSAASSRHNSISSHQSGANSRSCHGRPQSSQMAQHLRRASIIETRKARLADKAAHAEKVRSRAALVKATPRTSTASESRAIAAQLARERYLAQVVANCAEEVKRAKKVAEDMKERKAAEHLKLKEEMEEKLAEVERRRMIHQQNLRRSRATSFPAVEGKHVTTYAWKPSSDDAAARLIQRTWRDWKQRRIVADFLELGITVDHVKRVSFEDMSTLLGEEKVLSRTAKILKLCQLQDDACGGLGEVTVVRMFLSTFLILGHSSQVFSNDGEQERDLIGKAENLIKCFEDLFLSLTSGGSFSPSATHLASFSDAYSAFHTAFTAWRNHDSSFLVATMVAQFVELDAIWQTVKNDTLGGVADDYKEGIQRNQTLLLVRLKRLAGPENALKLVNDAVRERRKSDSKRRITEDITPRGATNTIDAPPTTEQKFSNLTEAEPQEPLGIRSLQAAELSKVISPLPDNRTIVHELSINKNYRIDPNPRSEIREIAIRVVFSRMQNDLKAGRGDRWVVSMAKTICDRLLRVVTPGKSLHVLINETLDPVLIENQLKAGTFSYERFFSFINTIFPKVCAPIRDAEIKALAADQSEDYIGRLKKVMIIMEHLSIDFSNHLLKVAAPILLEKAAEYEQRCFTEQMSDRKLINTHRWWSRARSKTLTEASRRATESSAGNTAPVIKPTSEKIYSQGLVELFICPPPLQPSDVPETLELDKSRIERIRTDILRITTISTILLTAKNLLKRDVRSQWKSESQRMWDLSNPYKEATSYLSIIESSHTLPPSIRSQLSGTTDRILSDARASPDISHPVMKVLLQKLKSHILTRLSASSAEDRLRSTTMAGEVLAQSGMAEFVGRIGGVVEELGRVKVVDWEAHGTWLDRVAKEVEGSS